MKTKVVKKGIVITTLLIFIVASITPAAYGTKLSTTLHERNPGLPAQSSTDPSEVWVDDDYYETGYNEGHTWGYNAFDTIQEGVDSVTDFGIIHINEGIYDVFTIEGRHSLDILGIDQPIITGNQLVYDLSYAALVYNVIFVNNSYNINIQGLHIIGTNPAPTNRDFTLFYQNSNGQLHDCTIDANSIQNMNAIAVRAILGSSLTISHCIMKDYGRIAVYAKTATILNISNCTLIGQIYTQYNWVNYGIEIEGIDQPCIGIIKGNTIYHHDNTQAAAWSSAAIIIDNWRYYGPDYNCKNSTVYIQHNKIYENMHGVQIVPNENIEMTYNQIHDNDFGAISDPWYDGSTYHQVFLHATQNWWGDPTGPHNDSVNPDGLGDEIYGRILFEPWLTDVAANLSCTGSLHWENVGTGTTVTGQFTVQNIGFIYSELSWTVDETPTWGVWSCDPESGTGLFPSDGPLTVHVTVIAPENKNKQFTGKLKIINTEDPTDYCEIDISLTTPLNKTIQFKIPFFEWLFEQFPHAFPFLRHLMGY
jgi:hypothetical protein